MSLLRRNVDEAAVTLQSLLALEGEVERAAELMAAALAAGHKLLTCGNGGSAADAMHLATEMVVRFDQDRRPYPALCLAASAGDLTAIANDYAFTEVFARQVEAFGQPGDVLVAISTSGRSENVRRAIPAPPRVLRADLLHAQRATVLVARVEDRIVGGAVLSGSPAVVGISNFFAENPGGEEGWTGLLALATALFPGATLVGYESGGALEVARTHGFDAVGPLRVWVREL